MIDCQGNCVWCGKRVESTGGCLECMSSMLWINPTYTCQPDGSYVETDPGYYGPTHLYRARRDSLSVFSSQLR
jgi:hypothetical protein